MLGCERVIKVRRMMYEVCDVVKRFGGEEKYILFLRRYLWVLC